MCYEQWALTVIKLLRFFCINICCFSTRLYILFVPQWHSHPSFIKIVDAFDLDTPQNQNVHCGVSSNDHIPRKRFCSRGVAWTRPPMSRTNRSRRKRNYSISNIGNTMGCDHPSFVTVGPLVGELWHFEYFPTWRPSAIMNFKNFTIWSRDCYCGPNLLFLTKFHQNWFTLSASRRP